MYLFIYLCMYLLIYLFINLFIILYYSLFSIDYSFLMIYDLFFMFYYLLSFLYSLLCIFFYMIYSLLSSLLLWFGWFGRFRWFFNGVDSSSPLRISTLDQENRKNIQEAWVFRVFDWGRMHCCHCAHENSKSEHRKMRGTVKTPAVKPCIVYIIDLPDSVGSKQS